MRRFEMKLKRKGFIWAAIFCGFILFILSAVVLGIAICDTTSKTRRIAVPIVTTWLVNLGELIFLSVVTLILSVYTIWSSIRARRKNKAAASVILLGHLLFFAGGIYLSHNLEKLYRVPDIDAEELFYIVNKTVRSGRTSSNSKFVPPWLDHIQQNSKSCCGVKTFHDWEVFWAPLEETYPESCCLRHRPNCTTSANDVVYPDLLGKNIKKNGGCYRLIIFKVKSIINQTMQFSSVLTVAIGVSLASVSALYLVVFFLKKSPAGGPPEDEDSDDGQLPKFPPDEMSWRNLEFYRVLVRKKKPKISSNFASATTSLQPITETSPDFETPMEQSKLNGPAVEYRVDVLSPNTLSPATAIIPPPQSSQPPRFPEEDENPLLVDSVEGNEMTSEAEGQDEKLRAQTRGFRKGRHRHRHRKDWQENEIEGPQN